MLNNALFNFIKTSVAVGMMFVFLSQSFAEETPPSNPAETVYLPRKTPIKSIPLDETEKYNAGAGADIIEVEPDDPERTPRAVITSDGETRLGCWLKLSAQNSVSPKNDLLEYEWKQNAGPKLFLNEKQLTTEHLWIFFEHVGEYRFSLRAKNSVGFGPRVEVKIKIQAEELLMPLQEGYRKVGAGEKIQLLGEGWTQIEGPKIDLRSEETGMFFRPIKAGLYIFEAPRSRDIPERRGIFVPVGRDKVFGDRRPHIELLDPTPRGLPKSPLTIDASLSHDADGIEETRALKATWTTPDKNRGVELIALEGLKAKFTATQPGLYSVWLVLNDGQLDSEPATQIIVQIENQEDTLDPKSALIWSAPDVTRDDLRYNSVKISLWESSLEQAVQLFPTRCGVALRVDTAWVAPENLKDIRLNLDVKNGPLLHVLDWMARQSDSFYRREKNHSFWLTHSLGFLKDDKSESFVEKVDELYSKPNAVDLIEMLNPFFQQILKADPNTYTLEYQKAHQELQGVLPAGAKNRLKDIFLALRTPSGQGLPLPEKMSAAQLRLSERLATHRVSIDTDGYPKRVDYILRQLAEETGIAIGFDPRQFEKGVPRIKMSLQHVPLREAIRALVESAGFDGCSVELPAGLWFYRGARPYPSRELLWDQSYVAVYDMSRLLNDVPMVSGDIIVHTIKRRIYQKSWEDPGALIFYHAGTQKLVVMHGDAGHQAVLEFLDDLQDRTEWALGPIDVESTLSPIIPVDE
jgi:hypothetical protein